MTHHHHSLQIVYVGDVFLVDGKRMTVLAMDESIAWLKDDRGSHYERRVQEIARCGKYVVRSTELPGYPICDMPEDCRFYLVSVKDCQDNPGSMPYNLCRKANGILYSLYGGGVYCGATHYHPFTPAYPES